MWTVKILKIEKKKINCDFLIEFSKDGLVFDTQTMYNVQPPFLIKNWISSQINLYSAVDLLNEATLLGQLDYTILEKTSDDLLAEKRRKLTQLKQDLELKIISQEEYDLAVAQVLNS